MMYTYLKRFNEAIADATRVTVMDPVWGKGWCRLGEARFQNGQYTEARRAFARGLQLRPDSYTLNTGIEKVECVMSLLGTSLRRFLIHRLLRRNEKRLKRREQKKEF